MGTSNSKSDCRKILVAEDDEANYYLLSFYLERLGSNVIWAKNGIEAVEYIKKNPKVCLVFMDVRMPFMDGLESASIIKSLYPEIPIVLNTAFAYIPEELLQHKKYFLDIVSKPIQEEYIKKTFENLNI